MIELLDFQNINNLSGSLGELRALLRQLLGQPFLFFRISYGDELTVHLGESREYPHPKMRRRRKGSHVLGARASAWYFRPGSQPIMFAGVEDSRFDAPSVAEKIDIREVESRSLVEVDSVVSRVEVLPSPEGFGLALVFSDRSTLIIVPVPDSPMSGPVDDEREDVADWELFTPYNRYLRVGPGPRWAYLESDKPASG